jgi:RND family efflux transporter MFP subunit
MKLGLPKAGFHSATGHATSAAKEFAMRAVGGWMLLVLLSACGVNEPEKAADAVIDVRVATIGSSSEAGTITAAGTVALRRETSLGFTSAGRIARLAVNEGDRVARGQVLAALDPTTTAATLAGAEAERVRALREYERSRDLFAKGWVPRPRVDSAEAALRAAEANVRSAGFQANNSRIVSPGSGIILSRLAEPGQVVAAGTPVLVLGEAASGMVLRLAVPDRDAARLRAGTPVEARIGALGDAVLTGRIIEIAGRADPSTGTFLVEVGLPSDARLRSGQVGSARMIAQGQTSTTLTVPPQALFSVRAGQGFVYVLDGNTVRARRVDLAETGDNGVRVLSGLSTGDRVAVTGIDRLGDGVSVRIVAAARQAGGTAR